MFGTVKYPVTQYPFPNGSLTFHKYSEAGMDPPLLLPPLTDGECSRLHVTESHPNIGLHATVGGA